MKTSAFCLFLFSICVFPVSADELDLKTLQTQADQGNALAEYELGKAYQLGHGVPADYAKAAELYRKAAAQGNAKSMFNLGYIYQHGQGVPMDNATALQWYQKAADQGLPAGQLAIGLAYYFGDMGPKKDCAVAAKWLTLAASQDNSPAQCAPAANDLGNLYENGWGVTRDGKQAVYWYTKSAELGYGKAQSNLGRIYHDGIVAPKDMAQSYFWLKVASDQQDLMATHLLPEYLAAKLYSDKQIAEGDLKAQEFESKHPRYKSVAGTPAPGRVLDPGLPVTMMVAPQTTAPATNSPSAQAPAGH